jgi:hypothetical protein
MLALQGCSRRLDEEASGRFEGWRHKRFGRAGAGERQAGTWRCGLPRKPPAG